MKNEKKQIKLSIEEMKDMADLHKEMMESIAKYTHKYKKDKSFEIFEFSIGLTISSFMGTFGIKNINHFLDDMILMIKQIHSDVQINSSYMEFKNGKKVSEGRFN